MLETLFVAPDGSRVVAFLLAVLVCPAGFVLLLLAIGFHLALNPLWGPTATRVFMGIFMVVAPFFVLVALAVFPFAPPEIAMFGNGGATGWIGVAWGAHYLYRRHGLGRACSPLGFWRHPPVIGGSDAGASELLPVGNVARRAWSSGSDSQTQANRGPMEIADLLKLDVITAGPLIRLMAARRGLEEQEFSVDEAWDILKWFARFPTRVRDHGCVFQAAPTEGDPNQVEIFMGRDLSEMTFGGWVRRRITGFQFIAAAPGGVDEMECWSENFESLDEFFAYVERTSAFAATRAAPSLVATFWVQEEDR